VAILAARRPDNDHHSTLQVSDCDDPPLTVVGAIVICLERIAGEDLGRVGEIQASLSERGVALGRIECDLQCI
jgi:hypothetical protein